MKKFLLPVSIWLWLAVLCFSVSAQDFKPVRDGIEYAEMTRRIDNLPVRINLLRLDLKKVRLDVVHAMDTAIGLEKPSSIAARYGAVAAINAGFFRIDKSIFEGDDVGTLMINGKLLSESNGRTALFIKNDKTGTQIGIDRLETDLALQLPRKITAKLSGINRERKTDELILYTPEFHRTTLTDNTGTEFIVENGRIIRIAEAQGSSVIPANGYVFSATGKMIEALKSFKIGDKLGAAPQLTSLAGNSSGNNFNLAQTEDAVSGVPRLIKNGKIEITWEEEKSSKSFVETKHPRTAVARLKDGKFLMVTVDGRSESSGGIGLQDLAELFLELGAVDAMNLDGGGSTTMVLDGKVVNHPSDKEGERKVSDAILVFQRR